ncbi:hypothetical protein PR048_032738 [Dryococelus australis]|uniref:Uncharacterized protein n=1 Tax=Dryococelus australis TaxID=614101 RepID=A0ABQ9G5W4_9NEOP|nr:hypothetical protein PR048_032738 [Dryococelus australis]
MARSPLMGYHGCTRQMTIVKHDDIHQGLSSRLTYDHVVQVAIGKIREFSDLYAGLHSRVYTRASHLGSLLVDDRPIINAAKYMVVSGVVWTNRTMVSSNTNTNRTGVLAVVDIGDSLLPAPFLRWLLPRCEVTPFLSELYVIGAHDCQVLSFIGAELPGACHIKCGPMTDVLQRAESLASPGTLGDSWEIPERRGTDAAICESAPASLCAVKSGTDLRDCGLDATQCINRKPTFRHPCNNTNGEIPLDGATKGKLVSRDDRMSQLRPRRHELRLADCQTAASGDGLSCGYLRPLPRSLSFLSCLSPGDEQNDADGRTDAFGFSSVKRIVQKSRSFRSRRNLGGISPWSGSRDTRVKTKMKDKDRVGSGKKFCTLGQNEVNSVPRVQCAKRVYKDKWEGAVLERPKLIPFSFCAQIRSEAPISTTARTPALLVSVLELTIVLLARTTPDTTMYFTAFIIGRYRSHNLRRAGNPNFHGSKTLKSSLRHRSPVRRPVFSTLLRRFPLKLGAFANTGRLSRRHNYVIPSFNTLRSAHVYWHFRQIRSESPVSTTARTPALLVSVLELAIVLLVHTTPDITLIVHPCTAVNINTRASVSRQSGVVRSLVPMGTEAKNSRAEFRELGSATRRRRGQRPPDNCVAVVARLVGLFPSLRRTRGRAAAKILRASTRFPPAWLCTTFEIHVFPPNYKTCVQCAGATVAERLARSPPTKANRVRSPARPPQDFRNEGQCRWAAGFLRDLPFPPAISFRRCSILTSITPIGSQDLAVKRRPNFLTHPNVSGLSPNPPPFTLRQCISPLQPLTNHATTFGRRASFRLGFRVRDENDPVIACHMASAPHTTSPRPGGQNSLLYVLPDELNVKTSRLCAVVAIHPRSRRFPAPQVTLRGWDDTQNILETITPNIQSSQCLVADGLLCRSRALLGYATLSLTHYFVRSNGTGATANRVKSPAESLPDFRMWDPCWTMALVGRFSLGSPVYPALPTRRCSILISTTLISSQDLDVKSHTTIFAHPLKRDKEKHDLGDIDPRDVIPALLHTHLTSPSSALRTQMLRAAPLKLLQRIRTQSECCLLGIPRDTPIYLPAGGSIEKSRTQSIPRAVDEVSHFLIYHSLANRDPLGGGVAQDREGSPVLTPSLPFAPPHPLPPPKPNRRGGVTFAVSAGGGGGKHSQYCLVLPPAPVSYVSIKTPALASDILYPPSLFLPSNTDNHFPSLLQSETLSIVAWTQRGPGYVPGESPSTRFVCESTKHQQWLLEDRDEQVTDQPYPRHVRWATCHFI